MTEEEQLREEITFLNGEIDGLRSRMAAQDNAAQHHKMGLLRRILERETRWLRALERRGQAA